MPRRGCKRVFFRVLLIVLVLNVERSLTLNCEQQKARKLATAEDGFIFECTPDGNFKPMQCEPKTGYCFCVNVLGVPMRDTALKHEQKNNIDCTKINNAPLAGSTYASKKLSFDLLSESFSPASPAESENKAKPVSAQAQQPQRDQDRPRVSEVKDTSSNSQPGRARRCNLEERELFLRNLLVKMQESAESNRAGQNRDIVAVRIGIGMRRPNFDDNRDMLDSKFHQLDLNHDRRLSKHEFRALESFSKTALNSTMAMESADIERCANLLHRYCDLNGDQFVSVNELLICMNPNNVYNIIRKHRKLRKQTQENTNADEDSEIVDETAPASKPRVARNGNRKRQEFKSDLRHPESSAANGFKMTGRFKEPPTLSAQSLSASAPPSAVSMSSMSIDSAVKKHRKDTKLNDSARFDCLVMRENSLKDAEANPRGLRLSLPFFPRCTENGGYEPIQCKIDICWCVSTITGKTLKQLPKNSTQNACDRNFKGCDVQRRSQFHRELGAQLDRQKLTCSTGFDRYDSDRDGVLNVKEWNVFKKSFRQLLSPQVKRCIKSEISFCDQDQNGVLSIDEWSLCCDESGSHSARGQSGDRNVGGVPGTGAAIDARRYTDFTTQSDRELRRVYNEKKDLPRNGPNPFQSILKGD